MHVSGDNCISNDKVNSNFSPYERNCHVGWLMSWPTKC